METTIFHDIKIKKNSTMKIYLIEISATDGEKFTDEYTHERIRRAFNFGNGTEKHFMEFINNNKNTIRLIDTYNIN